MATRTPGAQVLVSEFHPPGKGTRLWGGVGGVGGVGGDFLGWGQGGGGS